MKLKKELGKEKNFGNFRCFRWRKTKLYKRIIQMKIFGQPGTSFSPKGRLALMCLSLKNCNSDRIPTTKQGIEEDRQNCH